MAREFKDELPTLITRMVISTGIKVAAQYGVAKATEKQDPWVQLISRATVAVYEAAFNEADVRAWRTLPKQIQVTSFATPANGQVTLTFPGGVPAGAAAVQPGKANVVWVRSPGRGGPPLVRSFPIN